MYVCGSGWGGGGGGGAGESRQFIDKTTHQHSFWRQFTDTIEDNSSTLFEDNSPTNLFEGNWQS